MSQSGKIYGIVGENISYSLSPAIYNELFRRYGIDATYSIFDLSKGNLGRFMEAVKLLPISGFNVTTPHKISVGKYVERFDKISSITNSVNLVLNKRGKLHGYNTDFAGIKASCEVALGFRPRQERVIMFGSGGAAMTVFYYLTTCSVKSLTVVHRTRQGMKRFENFVRSLPGLISYNSLVIDEKLENISEHDLCINCTPAPITELMGRKAIAGSRRILELRYANFRPLKKDHICGKYMLAVQAVENFKLITGVEVSLSSVLKIIEKVRE